MLRTISALFLLGSLFSCEEIIEDCLFFPAKPRIETKNISNGKLGEQYSQVITGEVKNVSSDSDYNYFFEVSGLPEGLEYSKKGTRISIEGRPLKKGIYTIKVFMQITPDCIDIEDEFDCDDICLGNDSVEKKYKIEINE